MQFGVPSYRFLQLGLEDVEGCAIELKYSSAVGAEPDITFAVFVDVGYP